MEKNSNVAQVIFTFTGIENNNTQTHGNMTEHVRVSVYTKGISDNPDSAHAIYAWILMDNNKQIIQALNSAYQQICHSQGKNIKTGFRKLAPTDLH